MRRFYSLVMSFLIVTAISTVFADELGEEPEATKSTVKGMNGIINLCTFPLEWFMQAHKGTIRGINELDENPAVSRACGATWGFFVRGTHQGLGRFWTGVYETAAFWGLNPADNVDIGIPLDAKYAFEFAAPEHPTMKQSVEFVVNKLGRGAGNILWGATLELPTQIYDGIKFKTPARGFVRGTWYSFSRIINGVYEAGGFLLPNPNDTYGYAFSNDEPWRTFFLRSQQAQASTSW